MKTVASEVLYAVAWMFVGCVLCTVAKADESALDYPINYTPAIPVYEVDPRLAQIEQAWNAGDQAATQDSFSREYPFVMAQVGSRVNGNIKVVNALTTNFAPGFRTILAKVEINGKPEIWYMDECDGNPAKLCNYHHRETMAYPLFGGAEQGQALDVASTAYGLSQGFSEGGIGGNKGLLFTIPFKIARLVQGRTTNDLLECISMRGPDAVVGNAAGLKNIALMAGMATPLTWVLFGGAILYQHDDAMMTATFECAEFALNA